MVHHTATAARDTYHLDGEAWARGRNAISFIALISWIAAIAGFFLSPERFFQSYTLGFVCAVFLVLGSMFFLMTFYLAGAAWSVPMRRIAENIMITIPLGLVLFLPIAFGIHEIYEWSHTEVVARDHILQQKASYLNPTAFIIRTVVYFALWSLWAWRIYANSVKQDKTHSLTQMHNISRWCAPGLLVLVLSATLASFDWNMSLDPHWYSTIFGLYNLTGGGRLFIAIWILLCLELRENGILRNSINVEHYHDLGKWQFCLTVFWAYIAFSQYMLIWYANIPEETVWFMHRFEHGWGYMAFALLFGHFIIPFLVLLPRGTKRNLRILKYSSIWIVIFQFIDFYWQMMPNFAHGGGVAPHWLDIACPVAIMSAFALLFWNRMKAHAIIPVGDPRFEQGLNFQNV
jgi:hypothetical protein